MSNQFFSVKRGNNLRLIIILFFNLFCLAVYAQKSWDGGASTTNWGDANNWQPNGVPSSTDDVTIGNFPAITINVAAVCASFNTTVEDLSNGGRTISISGSNSLTVGGAITLNGTTGSTGGADPTILDIGSGIVSSTSLVINFTTNTNPRRAEVLLSTGTLSIAGNINVSASSNQSGISVSSTGIINVGGQFLTPIIGSNYGNFIPGTSTVNFNGAGDQNIESNDNFYNIIASGGGTKTRVSGFSILGNLTIENGVTFNVNTPTTTMGPNSIITVNGILDFSNSSGRISTGMDQNASIIIGVSGLIKTVDELGLGPILNASLETLGTGAWITSSINTNGTVEYYRNGTSGQIITDRDYNNIIITGGNQIKNWTLGADRTINGNLFLNNSAPLTFSGSQTVYVKGNISNSGNFVTGSSTINMNGSGVQSITGATTFNNLTINNVSGIIINTNETVNGVLNLTNGNITTAANKIIIPSTGSVSRTNGYIVGNLQKNVALGATSSTFEIGDASNFTPASVAFSNVSATGDLTASVSNSFTGGSTLSSSKYINRSWNITNVNTVFDNYSATFQYAAGDAVGSPSATRLKVGKLNGATWTYPSSSSSAATSSATATDMTSFSTFVLAELACVNPTITTTGIINTLCFDANAQAATLPYTATSSSLVSFSIDWDAGIVDQAVMTFSFSATGGDINNINIPASTIAGTYNGTMTIANACGGSVTKAISVTINDETLSAGTDGTLTICAGTTPTDGQLFASLGGSPSIGGSWTNVGLIYTYTQTGTSPCPNKTATVTVTEQPQAASVGGDGTLTICAGTTPTEAQLFASLGGSPSVGGTWTNVGLAYTYTQTGTSPCPNKTATVTVTEQPQAASAGSDGTLTVCAGTTPTEAQLFASLGGSPSSGGTWTNVGLTYTYTQTGIAPCPNKKATVTVTEQPQAVSAGTDGTLTICTGTTPTEAQLFASLGGSPSVGGTWTNVGLIYTYIQTGTSPCPNKTATVTVTEQPQAASAGSDGTLTVCAGTIPTEAQLFASLGGSPSVGGTWTNVGLIYTYIQTGTSPCPNKTAKVTVLMSNDPVSYNGNCYATIKDAFDADPPISGATIVILTNLTENNAIILPIGATLIINPNVTYINAGTLINRGIINNLGAFINTGTYKGSGVFNGRFLNEGNFENGN
jgi:hypothetical protein